MNVASLKSPKRRCDIRKLSELEGVAIGIIRKRQPCTAYALRMELKASPSSHWRASAGAIYPLLVRLEGDGFIRATKDAADGRGRKLLAPTARGERALRAWIREIVNSDRIAEVFDPLRTRVFFLSALSKSEQKDFMEKALGALEQYLATTQAYLAERSASDDPFEHLGAIAGTMNAESRIEMLKVVLARISKKQ